MGESLVSHRSRISSANSAPFEYGTVFFNPFNHIGLRVGRLRVKHNGTEILHAQINQ